MRQVFQIYFHEVEGVEFVICDSQTLGQTFLSTLYTSRRKRAVCRYAELLKLAQRKKLNAPSRFPDYIKDSHHFYVVSVFQTAETPQRLAEFSLAFHPNRITRLAPNFPTIPKHVHGTLRVCACATCM